MSEQKQVSFMQELDQWTEAAIARPLLKTAQDYDDSHVYDWDSAGSAIKQAVRAKVLQELPQRPSSRPKASGQKGAPMKNKLIDLATAAAVLGLPIGHPR
jgi:hypothetical protein